MPFLLLWQSWGVGTGVIPDTCVEGDLALLTYPKALVVDQSPISVVALSLGVPLALLPVQVYPLAELPIGTYPKATIVQSEPTKALPGGLTVQVYPIASIAVSTGSPIAMIECKEHV